MMIPIVRGSWPNLKDTFNSKMFTSSMKPANRSCATFHSMLVPVR